MNKKTYIAFESSKDSQKYSTIYKVEENGFYQVFPTTNLRAHGIVGFHWDWDYLANSLLKHCPADILTEEEAFVYLI